MITGAVLAGGASRRMGADKAALLRDDRTTLLEHACACLAAHLPRVVVIGGAAAPADTTLVPDRWPGQGPAAAVTTALEYTNAPVLVAACDLPGLDADAVAWLLHAAAACPDAPAVVPLVDDVLQPLFAVYRLPARNALADRVRAGRRSLTGWIVETDAAIITPPDHVAARLADVDTPDAWRAWRARTAVPHED